MNTCFSEGNRWTKDETGNKLFANISNCSVDGVRESTWLADKVNKYHRTFSTIINTLIEADLQIEKQMETVLTTEMLEAYPEYKDLLHKPDFLLVRAKKR